MPVSTALVQHRAMRNFLRRPRQVGTAQALEVRLQFSTGPGLLEDDFLVRLQVQVNQRHHDARQGAGFTQHPAVDARLGPVQGLPVFADSLEGASESLDFLDPLAVRVEAIGAAPNTQFAILRRQRYLAEVTAAPTRLHAQMPRNALLGAWRRHESEVEIAGFRSERAQRRDGNRRRGK